MRTRALFAAVGVGWLATAGLAAAVTLPGLQFDAAPYVQIGYGLRAGVSPVRRGPGGACCRPPLGPCATGTAR